MRIGAQNFFSVVLLSPAVILICFAQEIPAQSIPERFAAFETREELIQSDWLRQERILSLPDARIPVTCAEDAAGGCDGIKEGRYGFHTESEINPWWQVDLGESQAIDRIVIYNRCDRDELAKKAKTLCILFSEDGQHWNEFYKHNRSVFGGAPNSDPLNVPGKGQQTRYVRVALREEQYFHLDEVEVYGQKDRDFNLALFKPANQSSISGNSKRKIRFEKDLAAYYPVDRVTDRGIQLLRSLQAMGMDTTSSERELKTLKAAYLKIKDSNDAVRIQTLYHQARGLVREIAFSNPLLDFDSILFVKRIPGTYSHMSDQYYGWWSRPGGGIYILKGWKDENPQTICLTDSMAEGSFLRPDLSFDGRKIVFAYCRYYPGLRECEDKVNKENIPEDAFYHLYEMNIDGSGLRQLTSGDYDDFDARYLPNGEIVFLSTRRGQFIQCDADTAMSTVGKALGNSYVRCGGGNWRPVAIYALHTLNPDTGIMHAISPFENFEWTPSVAADGRILYARWDYVDRDNMPYMSLWSTNPDGTQPRIVYGNFTHAPHAMFEARSIPNSSKIVFTGTAHHSILGGCLTLLDPDRGVDGEDPITRLTPEVCYPEIEAWPYSYYANPYPLSETFYLTAWSDIPLVREGGANPPNALGLYLYDAFGNLELIYRDMDISSMYPIPIKIRQTPPVIASNVNWNTTRDADFLLQNVYEGLKDISKGTVKRLRIVGVPPKTQPHMNTPRLGITRDDPGKFVLGTVPVEEDGSAYFRVPAGVGVFFQALDKDGYAVQTMRTLTYAQAGQTLSCIGCHESRSTAPGNQQVQAAMRAPSKITAGPSGTWPLRYSDLVQPVLDRHCIQCHNPQSEHKEAASIPLNTDESYDMLVNAGNPSLKDHVLSRYYEGRSTAGACVARSSALLAMLRNGHHDVQLTPTDWERLTTWMDVYAQRLGSFSDEQEETLLALRNRTGHLLEH